MALLGRAYSSSDLCGVPGIDDVEAHVRHALHDYMKAKGMSLNGNYDDALKDLISTTIIKTVPEFDPGRSSMSLSTFVYGRILTRDVTQWLRDNVKDTRYGRRCPDCDVKDTVWVGNNQRRCRRCDLVYDDYSEVSLSDADRQTIAESFDRTLPEVYDLMNSIFPVLSPGGRRAMLKLVKPMVEEGLSELEAVRAYSDFTGRPSKDVRRMLDDLREEIECKSLMAA